MTLKIMGIKKGMTRVFDKEGNVVVCTVIAAEPNVISQIKNKTNDGYDAIQLSAIKNLKKKNVSKQMVGHFAKAKLEPYRHTSESRVDNIEEYAVGQEIGVGYFASSTFVDVTGVSKGKGFQGVIKRHNFAGRPASHGSGFHRHGGSTGMRTSPGRCLPGQKKAGHMGNEVVTVENLPIVKIDEARQVLLVKGAIPGPCGELVFIRKAKKRS